MEAQMKLNRILSMLLLLNILLASCATLEVGVETTQPAQPTAAATATMEIAQAARPTEIQSPMPTATVTEAAPAITLAPTAGSPATGLVYRLGDQVWQINADGNPVAMAAALDPQILPGQFTPRAVVFDGGRWMVSWWDWSDLWAVDLGSGQVRNITNTPSQEECCAQFWAARPDVLIFQSRLIETGGLASGFLATVNLDGSNYRILDETEAPLGLPALSPDGSTIAYDHAGKPWLYRWETGPEAFNVAEYGLAADPERYWLTSPAWSPNGAYLAYMVSGDLDGSGKPQSGVALFDLQARTYRLVRPFEPAGTEGALHAPIWSPDGNWLAVFENSLDQPGVWVIHPDGSGTLRAYAPAKVRGVLGLQAYWSRDGQRLLVSDPNAEGGTRLTLLNLLTNQVEDSPLPANAILMGWVGR
jgi:hypothetical protein